MRNVKVVTAYFVTATGTDIGKTFVTAGLIRHLRGAGAAVERDQAGGERLRSVGGRDQRSGGAARRARPAGQRRRDRHASRPGASARRCRPIWRPRAKAARIDFDELIAFSRRAVERRRTASCSSKASAASWCRSTTERTVLDWMAALRHSAAAGGRRLSRHHQPHADRARRAGAAPADNRRHRRQRKRA